MHNINNNLRFLNFNKIQKTETEKKKEIKENEKDIKIQKQEKPALEDVNKSVINSSLVLDIFEGKKLSIKQEKFDDVFEEFTKNVPDRTSTIEEKELAVSYINKLISCDDITPELKNYWTNKKDIIEMEIQNIKNEQKSGSGEKSEDIEKEYADFINNFYNTRNGEEEYNFTLKNTCISFINRFLSCEDLSEDMKSYFEGLKECIQNNDLNFYLNDNLSSIMDEINYYKNISIRNLWKTKDKDDYEQTFRQFLKESVAETGYINLVLDKFENMDLTHPITMEAIKEMLLNDYYNVDIPKGFIFEDMDWSNSREVFDYISFYPETFSKTSPEHFPEGFNPIEVFEKSKSIGLGIDDVHNMGYTGEGVSVAILDWQLKPHNDIQIQDYKCEENASGINEYFHASAVTSILAGQQGGVAPDAEVYFYAEYQNFKEENGGNDMVNALKDIAEKNKDLSPEKRIRVVSISGPFYGDKDELQAVLKELEAQGVWVFNSGEFWDNNFAYLEKKDPMGDINDFNNYQIFIDGGNDSPDTLYVNSGSRTVASPESEDDYRYDAKACASWAIPVVAGYYVLACQADPTMTKEKFMDLARQTAQVIESTIPVYDQNMVLQGRTEETRTIKIIDIKALLEAIEAQKN